MPRQNVTALLLTALSATALVTPLARAETAKWTCTKDGKEIKVKGANADAKKTVCEGKGGTWAEAEAKDKAKASAPAKQSSGGSGSW